MKRILLGVGWLVIMVSCSNSNDKDVLITDNSIGKLTKGATISQADSIYANDSIVKYTNEYTGKSVMAVYKKGGELSLEMISPDNNTIESVLVSDDRYITSEGIFLKSTFGDIRTKYPDLEIEQTFKSLIVSPKNHSFSFIIDRSQIHKPSLGYSDKITIDDIVDNASIKCIVLNW